MDKATKEQEYQNFLSAGWLALLGISVMIGLSELVTALIRSSLILLASPLGQQRWGMFCIVISIYALMSVLVRLVNHIWFRWVNVALFAFAIIFGIVHQIIHLMNGTFNSNSAIVDIAHHVVGIIVLIQAVRWARSSGSPEEYW